MLFVLPEHLQVTAEIILTHSLRMRSYTVHAPKPVSVRGMLSNTATQKNPHHAFCVQRGDLGTSFPHTLGREDQWSSGLAWLFTLRRKAPLPSAGRMAEPALTHRRGNMTATGKGWKSHRLDWFQTDL